MNTKHLYAAGFAITLGVIIWSDIKQCNRLPWPARIIAVGLLFGMLDMLSLLNEELAGVLSIGMTLAALVNVQPGGRIAPDCNATGAQTSAFRFQSGTVNPADYEAAMVTDVPIQQPGQILA